jgi:hypothetical protein
MNMGNDLIKRFQNQKQAEKCNYIESVKTNDGFTIRKCKNVDECVKNGYYKIYKQSCPFVSKLVYQKC